MPELDIESLAQELEQHGWLNLDPPEIRALLAECRRLTTALAQAEEERDAALEEVRLLAAERKVLTQCSATQAETIRQLLAEHPRPPLAYGSLGSRPAEEAATGLDALQARLDTATAARAVTETLDLDAITARHQPYDVPEDEQGVAGRFCYGERGDGYYGPRWPCDSARLLVECLRLHDAQAVLWAVADAARAFVHGPTWDIKAETYLVLREAVAALPEREPPP